MRILQILAGGEHGGAETAFVDVCIAMHHAGQIIEVVTRENEARVGRLREAGITVHCLPFGRRFDLVTYFGIRRVIKAFKPDIIQTWMSRAAEKVPRWTRSSGVPPYVHVARLGGYYKLKYYRNTDYFVANTPDIKRYLVENGINGDHVCQINNFAETEEAPVPVSSESLGVGADKTLLLALGRLHESKALDVLIEAIARIEDAYLWIAGEGPLRGALEAQIEGLGVGDRVRLLGWRSDRAALFQACDICVFPSRFEPFGTVFVQAWAQKRPLVTTASEGPRQFVKHDEDAIVVPVDDVHALEAAIRRVMHEPELGARLVENGYCRYVDGFTKERCVRAYMDFYTAIRANHRF